MRWYISAKLSRFALSCDCAASKFGLQKNPGHPPHFRTQHINTRQKKPQKTPRFENSTYDFLFPLNQLSLFSVASISYTSCYSLYTMSLQTFN